MAKRRTKKQKEGAKHRFNLSWAPGKPSVKGQFNFKAKKAKTTLARGENAMKLAKDASIASIKRDILKSLIIVSLILALEVVLYLAWYA